jgi:hypothetical protein
MAEHGSAPRTKKCRNSTACLWLATSKYIQTSPNGCDKDFVSRFVDNAVQIFDAAENAVRSGHTPSEMTILIDAEGGIRMLADSDWPLDSLQAQHGAGMAYRVSQNASAVRVEGRAGSRTCLFETPRPERAARHLLNRSPQVALQACIT